MVKAQILARSASQKVALAAYDEAMALPKTTSGQMLDIEFNLMRLGIFWGDVPFLDKHVQASHLLVDNGGDWERRNRLKVYEATYLLCIRDFKKASVLLLESISTFTAVELYGYPTFVYYTVICSTNALDRGTVRDKVRKCCFPPFTNIPSTMDLLCTLRNLTTTFSPCPGHPRTRDSPGNWR